jgi:hypothetical protein
MGIKEKKTVAQLVTLVMDKIREYPEYDHIAKVVVTRRIPRISGHANWTVEWSVIGNWSVPEGAYKIVERLCAQFDLACSKDLAGLARHETFGALDRASQVRSGLAGGGRGIRTLGPPCNGTAIQDVGSSG